MEILIQIVGWLGASFVLIAYLLITSKRVDGGSKLYQGLNLLGAVGVGTNVLHQQAWPALAIQIIWGIIAALALLNLIKPRS